MNLQVLIEIDSRVLFNGLSLGAGPDSCTSQSETEKYVISILTTYPAVNKSPGYFFLLGLPNGPDSLPFLLFRGTGSRYVPSLCGEI